MDNDKDIKADEELDLKNILTEEVKVSPSKLLSTEEKVKQQNRVRQLAYKARKAMPKDHRMYCLVAAHLLKNAHRYCNVEPEEAAKIKQEVEDVKKSVVDDENNSSAEYCREINKRLREIRTLKRQNRIAEQQALVGKLKEEGSYRTISRLAGTPLKTVHEWCSVPKERIHKGTSRAQLRQEEFVNFLMQDTITFSSPCQKYAGKRFLLDTWEQIYKKYLQQPQYHKHGILSKTTMRLYKPKYILLSGATPLSQCMCDYCVNCELMMKSLVACGVKGIPPNKYLAIESTVCDVRNGHFGEICGKQQFAQRDCIYRDCMECGVNKLKLTIEDLNRDILRLNRPITYHRWKSVEGKSTPQKCEIKKPLKSVVTDFLDLLENFSQHLFRSNWHRTVFDHVKKNLQPGYVLQVLDFAMNFNNRYQDEIQSAYYSGTQTTIHGTINFLLCPRQGCNEIVTLALVHISHDLKHDSFLSRAIQNLTFKYLVNMGIPLDLVIQFCDNCASQYKCRRVFAELARIALELIRVYYGEKHGKSHADALFGRLKAWMAYKIKTRHFIVQNAKDFYNYCREFYETPDLEEDCCQHYKVKFQYVRPSDIRRHNNADLDTHVEGTHDLYSVRNTKEPLELKVRKVPCLCEACIKEEGECLNKEYTDPWKLVKLVPEKGANKRKYQKRVRPDAHLKNAQAEAQAQATEVEEEISDDETLPDLVFNHPPTKEKPKKPVVKEPELVITDESRGSQIELIDLCEQSSLEFHMSASNIFQRNTNEPLQLEELAEDEIPDSVYWSSILTGLANCYDYTELETMALELYNKRLRPLDRRNKSEFIEGIDVRDTVAQKEIPPDGPTHLKAVKTGGDGNCLCRALSRSYFNTEAKHLKIRVRIVIEGIVNKKEYLSDACLERGATYIHQNA